MNTKKLIGKEIGIVRSTSEYSAFKRLKGNRAVSHSRVQKIKKSIEAVGFRMNPIVVNSKMEVIDGQGRLQALKELGKEVYYVVDENAGIEVCTWLNLGQQNWGIVDWVMSYAESGNEHYQKLLNVWDEYKDRGFSVDNVASMFQGVQCVNKILKSGLFVANVSESEIRDRLEFLTPLKGIRERVVGDMQYLLFAVDFAYQVEGIDKDRLMSNIIEKIDRNSQIGSMESSLRTIESFYNFRIRSDKKVYIYNQYQMAMDSKYSWYSKKYGIED